MKFIVLVTILSALIGLLIAVANADAACTTYIMPDGRIVNMCCSPDGQVCWFM